MKFLMFSQAGEGAHILKHIEDEGNEVGLFINDKLYKNVWDGLLPKVRPDEFVDAKTIIIFDLSGNGKTADAYRKRGHFVYGGSVFADNLEKDRRFGFQVMQEAGIKYPKSKEFQSFDEGIAYVRKTKERLVFKPSGDLPSKLTYVSSDPMELISYMTFVKEKFGKQIQDFILQDFMEGVVVSTEYFCDGKGFVEPANHTVEVKKFMSGDLGPSTGCSGNITWATDNDVLTENVIAMEHTCIHEGYVGQLDLNAVLTEDGEVYGLEWTPRFGYDATPTFMRLLGMEYGKFYSDMVHGQMKYLDCDESYAGSIRVTIPPYPAEVEDNVDPEKLSPNVGIPIQGYEGCQNDLYFYEVMMHKDQLVHSNGTGVICCPIGISDNVEKCLDLPYQIAEALVIPDKQYRTDLRDVLPQMINEVKEYADA